MCRDETIELMEPMLPAATRAIQDLIFTLIQQASELNAVLKPRTAEAVGDVLRSMNCYYSNLIEGHNTHPRDIDRALADDLSENMVGIPRFGQECSAIQSTFNGRRSAAR